VAGASLVQPIVTALGAWSAEAAAGALSSLSAALGPAGEPDYSSIVPFYDRMLAIALTISATLVALALMERILGGEEGAGAGVLLRVLVSTVGACAGLPLVAYAGHLAALLAGTWSGDLRSMAASLTALAGAYARGTEPALDPLGSALGLILAAVLTTLMALLIQVEMAARAALLLVTATFVPFVASLWIWPRLASTAGQLVGFLLGLLLSKFVIATSLAIGLHLVVEDASGGPKGRWLITGLAVLVISAFSPALLVGGLRFGHPRTAEAARSATRAAMGSGVRHGVQRLFRGTLERVGSGSAARTHQRRPGSDSTRPRSE